MSGRTLAILFVVLLLVAAAAILVNQRAPAPEPTPEIPPTPERVQFLEGATIESVTRLDVRDNLNDDFASFFRDGQGLWYQTNPTATLVISQTMNSQVTGLLNMTSQRTLGADENPLSAYGLDNPAYTVVLAFQGEDGLVTRALFLVGNETPAGTGYYLQKEGDPRVYIVPTFSLNSLISLLTSPPVPTPTAATAPISGTAPVSGTTTLTTTVPLTATLPLTGTGTPAAP